MYKTIMPYNIRYLASLNCDLLPLKVPSQSKTTAPPINIATNDINGDIINAAIAKEVGPEITGFVLAFLMNRS